MADEVPACGVLLSSTVACEEATADEEGGGAAEEDGDDETGLGDGSGVALLDS